MPPLALLAEGAGARARCCATTSRTSWPCAAAARWRCSWSRWCPSRRWSSAAPATWRARWCRWRAPGRLRRRSSSRKRRRWRTPERFPDAATHRRQLRSARLEETSPLDDRHLRRHRHARSRRRIRRCSSAGRDASWPTRADRLAAQDRDVQAAARAQAASTGTRSTAARAHRPRHRRRDARGDRGRHRRRADVPARAARRPQRDR